MWPMWLTAPLEPILRWFFGRDVFISYARADAAAYAARLAIRLGERHSVYLDQYDLPRGTKLPSRLQHALRRASAVAVVGSKGATQSHWVPIETAEFLKTGRPVLLIDVERALDGVPWAEAPWLDLTGVFRQPESAESLLAGQPSESVVTYVRESLTYTRQDQRLRRATAAAFGFLLVVAAATGVIVYQTNRRVNDAQRVAADAEQRAVAARSEEQRAREEAGRQQALASSRRLAGESSTQLDRQPGLAMLLAMQGARDAPTLDARRALLAAVLRYPQLLSLQASPHAGPIVSIASVPGGNRFATFDMTGATWLWDAGTRAPLTQVSEVEADVDFPFVRGLVAFSPDGKLLARQRAQGVAIWSVAERKDVANVTTEDGVMPSFAFVSDTVLVVADGHDLEWWDVSTTRPEKTASLPFDGETASLAADPTGRWLAVVFEGGIAFCASQSCRTTRTMLKTGSDDLSEILAVGGDPERPLVASADVKGTVTVWDARARSTFGSLTVQRPVATEVEAPVRALAFSPDGKRLAVTAFDGNILVASLERGPRSSSAIPLEKREVVYGPGALTVAFAPAGQQLITTSLDTMISFWDFDGPLPFERRLAFPAERKPPANCANVGLQERNAHASDDGSVVVLARGCEVVASVAPHSGEPARMATVHTGPITATAVSADGKWIASAGPVTPQRDDLTIVLWQGGEPKYQARVSSSWRATADGWLSFMDGPSSPRVAFVQGSVPAKMTERLAVFWDPAGAQKEPRIIRRPGSYAVMGIAVDRAKGLIATREIGSPSNYLWQVETDTFMPLPAPKDFSGAKALGFSHDGRDLIAVGSARGGGAQKVTWNLGARPITVQASALYTPAEESALEIAGKSNMLHEAVIGAGGRLLVEFHDGLYTLWDLESDAFLASFTIAEHLAYPEFVGAGEELIAGLFGSITLLDLSQRALERHICAVVRDPPTDQELQRLFGGRSDLAFCEPATK